MCDLTQQKGLHRCDLGSWDGEMILGYSGGSNVIGRVLMRGKAGELEAEKEM